MMGGRGDIKGTYEADSGDKGRNMPILSNWCMVAQQESQNVGNGL